MLLTKEIYQEKLRNLYSLKLALEKLSFSMVVSNLLLLPTTVLANQFKFLSWDA
jgi:hypothetical protein